MKRLGLFTLFTILCALLSAQVGYDFSQSTEAYTEITGGTSLGNTSTNDQCFVDPSVPLGGTATTGLGLPIGFDFTFNETVFDRIAINANGWISFGQSALSPSVNISSSSAYTPLSSTAAITPARLGNRASVFACDLQAKSGSTLRMQTMGTAPHRKCIIQWKDYIRPGYTGDNLNFQIVLTETANLVEFRYGNNYGCTPSITSYTQVGLRGPETSDFFNRSSPNNWAATTAGTTNTANIPFGYAFKPASGLVFTYTFNSNFFAGGSGTQQDPYQVATAEQLNNVRSRLQEHYIQTADISLDLAPWNQGEGWPPIPDFSKTYNGNGKKITGLYINRPASSDQGLFGQISNATISNLGLVAATVTGSSYTGGLIGKINSGTVRYCSATGNVTGSSKVGGLAGSASGTIENCHSSATVSGSGDNTGGLIGSFSTGNIENCFATGNVTGSSKVGGLVGHNDNASISQSYTTGNVAGSSKVGGLAGAASGSIENCNSSATVSGSGDNTGGLIGSFSTGNIENCFATGNVTGSSYSGGLAGTASGIIENCYSSATVSGSSYTGGLIGKFSTGAIEYCFATGNVTGSSKVGGLVGHNDGASIIQSYATGDVTGSSYSGGLAGTASGIIEHCYSSTTVSGSGDYTGGLIGSFSSGTIKYCFAAGDVTGSSGYVGGLAGSASGTIEHCNSSATVSGSGDYTGGLVGDFSTGAIKYCSVTGDVTGSAKVGGLVGGNHNNASVMQSCASGDVAGSSRVGGLVGWHESASTIQNCFAEGDVTRISGDNTEFGGFCGYNDNSKIYKSYCLGKVLQSPEGPVWADRGFLGAVSTGSSYQMTGNFFCTETSGAASSLGSTENSSQYPVGKGIAHMQYIPTFTDAAWDFETVWLTLLEYQMYPRLMGTDLFYANTRSGYAPLTVKFHDLSGIANPSSWAWNFGDGSSSTEQNPSHQYTAIGAYTVSLSVTNGVDTEARAVPNYVNTVECASTFHLLSPSSSSTDLDVYPRFEWSSLNTRERTAFHYELILSTLPSFPPATTVVYSTTNTYLYPPQDLKVGCNYYWKVKACFEDNTEMMADMNGQAYWMLSTVPQIPQTFPMINGLIPGNRTLTKENSPYWFDLAPRTAEHHKLTFEAGVTLKFNSGVGLTLGGEFLCEGTAVDSIRFEGYTDANLWSGININNASQDYVSGNQINYTVIKNVNGTALSSSNTDFYISNSRFSEVDQACDFGGNYSNNNTLSDCFNAVSSSSQANLTNSGLSDNRDYAVTGRLSFTNCRFLHNRGPNVISINSTLPVYFEDNLFSHNTGDNLIELQNPGASYTLTNNNFSYNQGLSLIKCSAGTVNINDNTLSYNQLNGKAAIWAAGGTVNIEHNTLTYNEAVIVLDNNNMATAVYIEPGSTCSITKNLITNNTGPYAIWGAAQEIKDNNFFGNVNTDYYPMNIRHTDSSNRAYTDNFWGARSDLGNINPTLYHNVYDPSLGLTLGVITYQPIRTGPSPLTPGQLFIVNDVMVTRTEQDITPNTPGLIPERAVLICLMGEDGNAFSQDITEVNVNNMATGFNFQPLVWETGEDTGIFRTTISISETVHNPQLSILQASIGDIIRFQSVVDPTKACYLPVIGSEPYIDLPDTFSFAQDGSLTVDFSTYVDDVDINELTLSYSGATNVIVSITGLSVTFTATPNWYGTENLTFTVSNGEFSANDEVEVNVNSTHLDSPIIRSIVKTLTGIQIQWQPVDRAASYRVYRSFEPYGEYTYLGSTDQTEFVDTEFGNHARAFYRIVGTDQENERNNQ
jgi:PKD repeat protein